MRTGIILSFNRVIGVGVIKDANHQHILFQYSTRGVIPVRGSAVTFDIQFRHGSLAAVNVRFLEVKVLSDNIMLSE